MSPHDFPSKSKQLRVLMMPDYRIDNPYQKLLVTALDEYGVKVLFPIGYRRVFPILRAVVQQTEIIDIVHIHWLETYLKGKNIFIKLLYSSKFLTDILLVRLLGIKVVWTIHNHLEHDTPFPCLELWIRKILVTLTNQLIIHNDSSLGILSSQYGVSIITKVSVISHGHYRNIYGNLIEQRQARQLLKLPLEKRIYLNLGMIRPYKGIENLLRIWQKHQAILEDSLLIIAGKPLNREYGENIAKQITELNNVLFYDYFIANEDIHLFFSSADIVVLPFQKVLTSGSAILAMSFNKPIIAPTMGSLSEILGKANTLLYDPKDEKGLETAIQKSRDCNLQELSKLVVKSCDDLGWQEIGYKTVKVYQKCLNYS